jgi:DNA-binding NarL/FixJ family response regulator
MHSRNVLEESQSKVWPDGERKIILVDAHFLMRLALQRVIAAFPLLRIVASLSAIEEIFPFAGDMATYTIVLGPSIPVSECLQLVKQLREQRVCCHVVAIQQGLHPETVRVLIEQGVHGLLDEAASEQDLIQALMVESPQNIFLSQRARNMLAASMTRVAQHLTEREIQVLSHLKHGESNFRIARGLGLKEKTIEKYLTSIYDKLNVRSRAEAILCIQQFHF